MPIPSTEGLPEEVPYSGDTGTGFLVVRASTALGAIPLEGALVNIRTAADRAVSATENGTLVASLRTNRDGLTSRVALPAPSKVLSESPGNELPYAVYDLDVSLDGYATQYFQRLPIFDTITSLQAVEMTPLPEGQRPELGQNPPSRLFVEFQNPL